MTSHSEIITLATDDPLSEVVDSHDKALLYMPQRSVIKQNLRYRQIAVNLQDMQGNIFLSRNSKNVEGPTLWTLAATTLVLPQEAKEEAALRALNRNLGLPEMALRFLFALPSTERMRNQVTTVFCSGKNSAIPKHSEGMFVDQEELRAILHNVPHMVSPLLFEAAPRLFPEK